MSQRTLQIVLVAIMPFMLASCNRSDNKTDVSGKNSATPDASTTPSVPQTSNLQQRCEELYKEFVKAAVAKQYSTVLDLTADGGGDRYRIQSSETIIASRTRDGYDEFISDLNRMSQRLLPVHEQLDSLIFSEPVFTEDVKVVDLNTLSEDELKSTPTPEERERLLTKATTSAKLYLVYTHITIDGAAKETKLEFLLIGDRLLHSPW